MTRYLSTHHVFREDFLNHDTEIVFHAEISEAEFLAARDRTPALADYPAYGDWLEEREALEIGLDASGVEIVKVPLSLAQCQVGALRLHDLYDAKTIDAIAARVARFRSLPHLPCWAEISAPDFRRHRQRISACRGFETYEAWRRHRQQRRSHGLAGYHEFGIDIAAFLEWAACVSLPPTELNLDNYARLSFEYLAADTRG